MKMKGGLKAVREKSSLCREFSEVEKKALWCSFLPTLTPVIIDALGRKVKGSRSRRKK